MSVAVDAKGVRRHEAISGHRRRGLVDGKQRVACHPMRTKPVSMARCVPRAPQRNVSTICRVPINRANCLSGSRDPFNRDTTYPGNLGNRRNIQGF